jgi:hypothetical protein
MKKCLKNKKRLWTLNQLIKNDNSVPDDGLFRPIRIPGLIAINNSNNEATKKNFNLFQFL